MLVRNARELGALLRDTRQRQRLTQEQVASRANVQRTWLSHLESGEGNPSLRSLLAVGAALGLTVDIRSSMDTAAPPADQDLPPPVDLNQLLDGVDRAAP